MHREEPRVNTPLDLTGTGALKATATAAAASNQVTVSIGGQVTTINVARDLTVASGDVLIVMRVGAEWFAIGRAYGAAPTPDPTDPPPVTPPPKPPVVNGKSVFAPVETRSYRTVFTGWRTDNTSVYQGQYGGNGNHTGCAFYGTAPRSLAGATVTSARIQVQRLSGGAYAAQPTTMRLVTQRTRPSGAPTLTSSTSGPSLAVGATNNSFAIPTSWAQAMVDGTAGGLGFFDSDGSPYVRFAGRGDWGPAFTITINWQRG
jgi:hypothetical protein